MTVTVCGAFQFEVVNVSELVTDVSVLSDETMSITTLVSGWASRTTVNVSVVPDSATAVEPLVSVTVNSGISSSVVVTTTV